MKRVISFDQKGEKLLIISGVHGNEVGAVNLSFKLYEYYKNSNDTTTAIPSGISSITFIHVANKEGIRRNVRDQVYDSNLNNSFNTEENPREELIAAIKDSKYIIDLHCSPYMASGFLLETDFKSFLIKEFLEENFKLELFSGDLNYSVRSTKLDTIKSLVNKCKDKFGFTWEQNGMDRISLDNCKSSKMLIKFINKLHKLENRSKQDYNDYNMELSTVINTPAEGYLEYYYELGSIIKKDTLFGCIRDMYTNDIIYDIRVPFDCKFIIGNNDLYVNCFDFVAMIHPIEFYKYSNIDIYDNTSN